MLRCPPDAVSRGLVTWLGKGNAFGSRLNALLAAPGAPAARQTLADWLAVWGRPGEQGALVVEPRPTTKAFQRGRAAA